MPNSPVEVRSEVVPFMTEERLALQEMARDFAMREVLPIANELDPVAGELPMELRRKMADLGFFGILVPEEYGGLEDPDHLGAAFDLLVQPLLSGPVGSCSG